MIQWPLEMFFASIRDLSNQAGKLAQASLPADQEFNLDIQQLTEMAKQPVKTDILN